MRVRVYRFGLTAIVSVFVVASVWANTPLDTAFTYQGELRQGGLPADTTADFEFTLWDDAQMGMQVGAGVYLGNVPVAQGRFTVTLDFGSAAFAGAERWLEVAVRAPHDPTGTLPMTTLSPRQKLTATPYATFALRNWGLAGNAGTDPVTDFIGTTDEQPLVFKVNGEEVLRIAPPGDAKTCGTPPVIWWPWNVSFPLWWFGGPCGVVIAGGGSWWLPNQAFDDFGTISGGEGNTVGINDGLETNEPYATVGGGGGNTASGPYSVVGGGGGNVASGVLSAIGGGEVNTASGDWATVAGGLNNQADGTWAMIPGGESNRALGQCSFAAGLMAHALHAGSFAWADSTGAGCATDAPDQFRVQAAGGVGINVGPGIVGRPLQVGSASNPGSTGVVRLGHCNAAGTRWREWDLGTGDGALFSDVDWFGIADCGTPIMVIKADTPDPNEDCVGFGTLDPKRIVHIKDVLRLEPRTGAPPAAAEGDLYVDGNTHHIYCYLGGAWKQLD